MTTNRIRRMRHSLTVFTAVAVTVAVAVVPESEMDKIGVPSHAAFLIFD
jgi:hypothetical protein